MNHCAVIFTPLAGVLYSSRMSQSHELSAAGPGDSSRFLPMADLMTGLHNLPPGAKNSGRVVQIVRRPRKDAREILPRVRLSPEVGLPGDAWGQQPDRNPEMQLAVMRWAVAELIANGQPPLLAGDNLFIEMDVSQANLPTGTRLRVGQAVVVVTPVPHNGCRKFSARFGVDAFRFVNAPPTRDQNLRGIYWRVLEAGEVEVGSPIQVLSR